VRVLLACPYAWDAPGGVQAHIRGLAGYLREAGHEVRIVTPATTADDPAVEVVAAPVRVPYRGTVAPIAPWPGQRRRIRSVIESFAPDVVHAHEPLVPSTSRMAARVSPVPVVGTFHAFAERSLLLRLGRPAVAGAWKRLAARIAVSEAAADFVSGPLQPRPRIIPNGVDVEAFGRALPAQELPEGRRVVWVNRLDPQKGFPIAVAAFERMAESAGDLWFVVAGDGRDRTAVRSLPPDVGARVMLLGDIPHERVPSILAGAAALVSPAIGQESFGVVLVEAMAAGVPVVASDIPGYRDVVRDGVDGLLVPPRDAEALAAAVGSLLRDPGRAERLRNAGRARAGRFAWERVGAEIEAVYQDVLRR
jgi:phosphatidylinositol alpha-mannosyltransferase